jgi:molybdenum cofactor synthesis domain-containing protein
MGVRKEKSMKPFKELITRKDALEKIITNIRPISRTEEIYLADSDRRVLATNINASFNVPSFDRSAMDGYAVRAFQTSGASMAKPVKLKIIGTQHPGELIKNRVKNGECVEIATGAPIPENTDAVVMVEYTKKKNDFVHIFRSVKPGTNIAPAGEDIKQGQRILEIDSLLTPGKVGTLAALGFEKIKVFQKPRVAIYSSGQEIVQQGQALKPGQIYDINSFTLSSIINRNNCIAFKKGIIRDDHDSIRLAVQEASKYDLGIFSGGSSVGSRDLFAEIVQEQGAVLFHGVQIKPGKPTLFGKVNKTPIFGMPGYPTSCLNNGYVFLIPALRKISRLPPLNYRKITVPMGHKMESKSDREQFITVNLRKGHAYRVFKHSGNITSMTQAEGFIILPIGKSTIENGEKVEVTLLDD